jgi:hypothetical protein
MPARNLARPQQEEEAMKTKLLSPAVSSSASLLFCSFLAIHPNASAIDVDTELLLLVDVSGSVSTTEYQLMMNGYANAFRQTSVLDSIQSGARGSVAVALAFWSDANQQRVGMNWTLISDKASANTFADSLGKLSRPYSSTTALASGINFGTRLFGTETGGTDNGFSSLVQVIDVGGDGEDNASPWAKADLSGAVRAARDGALAAGVDMINGLPIGRGAGDLVGYYAANVAGGSAGGVDAFVQPTATFADIEKSLTTKLNREVGAAAAQSIENISAVPEPGYLPLIGGSLGMLLLVRRRNA